MPPMLQLVQSPHASGPCLIRVLRVSTNFVADAASCAVLKASGLYLTRVFLAQAETVPPMLQFVQSPNAFGLYSTRVFLAGTNFAANTAACAVSGRLGSLLDLGSSSRYKLCRRCCSLCSNDSAHNVPSSTVL